MSLIQEALEKAGKTIEEIAPLPQTPILTQALRVESKKTSAEPSFYKRNSQVIILAAGLVLFLAGLTSYHLLSTWAQHSSPKKDRGKALLPFVEARVPSLVPDLSLGPRFHLTGITVSGSERLALINNQVVRAGDLLEENAIVKEIQERRVILEFHGREVKLSL